MATEELRVAAQLRRPLLRRVLSRLFVLYIVTNMALCAVLFAPWALPRETISGLIGRWVETESGLKRLFAKAAERLVNRIYAWEPNHCVETYRIEKQVRAILYPELGE